MQEKVHAAVKRRQSEKLKKLADELLTLGELPKIVQRCIKIGDMVKSIHILGEFKATEDYEDVTVHGEEGKCLARSFHNCNFNTPPDGNVVVRTERDFGINGGLGNVDLEGREGSGTIMGCEFKWAGPWGGDTGRNAPELVVAKMISKERCDLVQNGSLSPDFLVIYMSSHGSGKTQLKYKQAGLEPFKCKEFQCKDSSGDDVVMYGYYIEITATNTLPNYKTIQAKKLQTAKDAEDKAKDAADQKFKKGKKRLYSQLSSIATTIQTATTTQPNKDLWSVYIRKPSPSFQLRDV